MNDFVHYHILYVPFADYGASLVPRCVQGWHHRDEGVISMRKRSLSGRTAGKSYDASTLEVQHERERMRSKTNMSATMDADQASCYAALFYFM